METRSHEHNFKLKEDTRQKYDRIARIYPLINPIEETMMGVRKLRRNLLSKSSGKVLEIAVGTGVNFRYYNRDCDITAVDLSPALLEIARKKAAKLGLNVNFLVADAESLDFPDQSFDTVISSMALCTFPEPITALREMARVCRRGGRILLLEHGRSDREWLGRRQDRNVEKHAKRLNCVWNRNPFELVKDAGLKVIESHRYRLGMLHIIVASPPDSRTI